MLARTQQGIDLCQMTPSAGVLSDAERRKALRSVPSTDVVGSQAVLATIPEFLLPPEATMSVEADLIPLDGTEALAARIDGVTGLCPEIDDLWLTKLAARARP